MPGWSPHHRPPGSSHWPGSAQEVSLDCGPEVFQPPCFRFEYKYSFKPPYLAQKDGSVPFFEYSGEKSWFDHATWELPPSPICLIFLSSWEMFAFQGMLSLLKKASELLQVLEVRRGWFGVKKQQTLIGKRATNVTLFKQAHQVGGGSYFQSDWERKDRCRRSCFLVYSSKGMFVTAIFLGSWKKTAILSTLQSTESPATGHVYGSVDRWIGLGLFFDSFDNDNKHNNPYIMAMTNDGTKNFDHQVQLEMKSWNLTYFSNIYRTTDLLSN